MDWNRLSYVAVEGPIGVGKTSLAKIIAQDLKAHFVSEDPDQNPFLPQFYEDPTRYGFQAQLFFLLSRYGQQTDLKQQDLFAQKIVCDYVFAKDMIFAGLNLSPDEMRLYSQIYALLDQRLPKPQVVILLQSDPEVLLKRIRKRGKGYESDLALDYLTRLSQAYSEFFFQYHDFPVLVVNTSELDFVKHTNDYEMIRKELLYLLRSGLEKHYVTIKPR